MGEYVTIQDYHNANQRAGVVNGALNVNIAGGSSGGAPIAVSVTPPSVTPHQVAVPASTSAAIPIGAKGWTITFLTGTGTFGGVAVAAGFSDNDPNTLLAAIPYTTNSASTAYVRYNT